MSFRRRSSLNPSLYLPYSQSNYSSYSSPYLSRTPSSSSLYLNSSSPSSSALSRSRSRSSSYSNLSYIPRTLSSSSIYQDPYASGSASNLSSSGYRSRSTASSRNSVKSDTADSGISSSTSHITSKDNHYPSTDSKDFKKLYEESLVQIEALKKELAQKEQEWAREKRQQQRKISELEEEVKAIETLKTDNQRLKDENGALIRVISKLSK